MNVFEGFPLVVGLELTLACNLHCKHCASIAGASRVNELSTGEILSLCNQFPALLVQEVDCTGGEPFLRPDWDIITSHLDQLKINTRIVSNGILLKNNIEKLKNSKVKTVGVSLDGLESIHDSVRECSGLFKLIISNIEVALNADIPIAVITSVGDHNVDQLNALGDFLIALGIKHWQVQPIFSLGRAEKFMKISEETFLKLGKFLFEWQSKQTELDVVCADGVGYYTELDFRSKLWKGCSAGRASCGITSNGNVKGCLSMPDTISEGNIREKDLWDIWFDENAFSYNRCFKIEDLGNNCNNCDKGENCLGGCPTMSYAATKLFHNDPLCFYRLKNK